MGFSFGGVSSQSMKIKARITQFQTLPQLRNSFITIPGNPGISDFGCDVGERIITVLCSIFPQNKFSDTVKILDNVVEWLNPQNGLKQLIMDDMPDRYFNARLSEAVNFDKLILSAGTFELKFVCPNPYGYALTDESYTLTLAGNNTVTRTKGNTNSEPHYYLKGTITSGTSTYISITTNGVSMRVIGALSAGETLVIDSDLMTAKVINASSATLRNGLPCLQELNFPALKKGTNSINIAVEGAAFTELKIQAKSRWQ